MYKAAIVIYISLLIFILYQCITKKKLHTGKNLIIFFFFEKWIRIIWLNITSETYKDNQKKSISVLLVAIGLTFKTVYNGV